VHFNVTDSPTAAWPAQQIVEAFPDDSAPRYVLRDRDSIYGGEFRRRVKGMLIAEVLTAPRSPWQNPFVERVIGTIRRELLDHVIVLNEGHLRRRCTATCATRTARAPISHSRRRCSALLRRLQPAVRFDMRSSSSRWQAPRAGRTSTGWIEFWPTRSTTSGSTSGISSATPGSNRPRDPNKLLAVLLTVSIHDNLQA